MTGAKVVSSQALCVTLTSDYEVRQILMVIKYMIALLTADMWIGLRKRSISNVPPDCRINGDNYSQCSSQDFFIEWGR